MNERMLELFQQSLGVNYIPVPIEDHVPLFVEKFTELIVQECCEQIIAKGTDWMDWAPSQLAIRPEYVAMVEHIKQHFGVE